MSGTLSDTAGSKAMTLRRALKNSIRRNLMIRIIFLFLAIVFFVIFLAAC